MPKNLPKKIDKNEVLCFQKDGMNMFGFKDKEKDVTMLSTFHSKNTVNVGINKRTQKQIVKLECVFDYNQNMGE